MMQFIYSMIYFIMLILLSYRGILKM